MCAFHPLDLETGHRLPCFTMKRGKKRGAGPVDFLPGGDIFECKLRFQDGSLFNGPGGIVGSTIMMIYCNNINIYIYT